LEWSQDTDVAGNDTDSLAQAEVDFIGWFVREADQALPDRAELVSE
jgi:hypothetical protein